MRRKLNIILLFGLLISLNINAFGQFHFNASTIPYERVVNGSCLTDPTYISPTKGSPQTILVYLKVTYSDNVIITNFIDGTGSFEGAEGLPTVDYTNYEKTDVSECEWTFTREYSLTRIIDDYNYLVTLTENITVKHDNHLTFKTYHMSDVELYGEGEESLPQGEIEDLQEIEDLEVPCGNMDLVTMTYEDVLIDDTPPYLTFKRTYKLTSKCSEENFANVERIFKVGVILKATTALNTLYYNESDYPEPYSTLQQLRENGGDISYPLKYETDLIIESEDEDHPVIDGATRRKYKVTNPYADEHGLYRYVHLYQTLIKIPDVDAGFYIRYENGDLNTSNKAKLYIGTSPWDQGPESERLMPWNWYYVNLQKIEDGEIVDDVNYTLQQDKCECIDCSTANRVYEFLVDDELEGGKYNVEIRTKAAYSGLPADYVVYKTSFKVGVVNMAVYANPVGVMLKYGYQVGLYVATAATHLINLDDDNKPIYSGYCAELTYDNLIAKNRPDFYSVCNHAYIDFTYSWEINKGSRCTEIPLYYKYGNFGMGFELYYYKYNYSIWGENPDLLMTKNSRSVKLSATMSGTTYESEPRVITWKALTCSDDPNEIVGPEGYGDNKMIAAADRIDYKIYFENDTTATSAASRVVIRCPLHHRADSTTVRLGSFGFGEYSFEVPAMSSHYNKRITETIDSLGVCVDVTAGLDVDNNEMYWIFQSIDPETGNAPIDSIGFLPVNDTLTGCGEGFVTFSVSALDNTVTGDTIAEQATITFDENDAMATNIYVNTFDAVSPTSVMVCDTTTAMTDYILKFKALATDDEGGSGSQYVNLFVNVDNTQYVFAKRMDSDTALYADSVYTTYKLGQGSVYKFVAQATDNVGNVETFKTTPDFVYVNKFPPTDMFLTNRYFNEGDTVATKIGDFYTIDDQSTADFKYALIEGEGDTDNDKFSIDSCFLRTNYDFRCQDMFDFEIRVKCTDNSGATFEKAFQLHAIETETPPVTEVDTTICFGESITFGGQQINEVGYYYDTLQTVRGCDSVVKMSLNIYPELVHFNLDTLHCIYEDFSIPGFRLPWDSISQRLTKWTETSDTLLVYQYDTINANGCADVMHLNMHVYPQERDYHHVYACYNGLPYRYGDTLFTEAGTKDVHFKSKITGCDSVVTVELEVNPIYLNVPLDTTICSNDTLELFGQKFTEEGEYKVYGETAIHHCDSMVALTLHVKPISEKEYEYVACPTELPTEYGGFEITSDMTSGIYTHTFPAVNGCDSIVTLNLTVRNADTQITDFEGGWYWYSTYLDLDEINALQALEDSLGSKGSQIKSHSEGFDTYTPGIGWMGNLEEIENERMYMIQTTDTVAVDLFSCLTTGPEHPITIRKGWNWIGYVSQYSNSTVNALGSITPAEGDIIKSYDHGFAAYYDVLGGWFGSLTQMQPGVGYMYYSNNDNDITLTYPEPAKDEGEQLKMLPTHWNAIAGKYPNNMTFIGKITIDNIPTTTDNLEVGVFCNGEVRGSGRAILMEGLGTYRLFIQVYGDNGDNLTFKLYDHKLGREHDAKSYQKLQFADNANYGSIHDPYPFKFYTGYVNPDNDDMESGTVTDGDDMNEEGMSHELTLVPNPAKSSHRVLLYCDFTPEERDGLVVEVFNDLGVKIQQIEPTRYPVQLNEIEHAGNYLVRVTTGTGRTMSKKLVITR